MLTENLDKIKWQDSLKKAIWPNRLKGFGLFLLASLSPVFAAPAKESKIAYLDGLRGFAAFIVSHAILARAHFAFPLLFVAMTKMGAVYCTHHTAFAHDAERRLHHAFGFRDEYLFACLPFVRVFFVGGAFAVALFFAISGYALSVSPMNLINTQRPGEALHARLSMQLGSSFPRRWVRLYVPVIITTFIFMTSWHLFRIESSNPASSGPSATYVTEFGKWLDEFIEGSYVFVTGAGFGQSEYNPHMWSIAVEYRGSAIIYIAILSYYALGYGPNARFWAGLGLFTYFQYIADGPYYALFIMGMLLCDLDMVSELNPHQLPRVLKFDFLQKHRWIYYVLLILGLYLGSAPHIADANNLPGEPGWALLSYLVPSTSSNARWYFVVYSATLCVISIPRISLLRRMFETSVFQYLGKISFGFYLVHGPVMWIVGDRLIAAVGRPRRTAETRIPSWINLFPLTDSGPLGLELNALVPHLILLPLTLWLGGVVTKLVDVPSVKLSKWLFKQRTETTKAVENDNEMKAMLPYFNDQQPR